MSKDKNGKRLKVGDTIKGTITKILLSDFYTNDKTLVILNGTVTIDGTSLKHLEKVEPTWTESDIRVAVAKWLSIKDVKYIDRHMIKIIELLKTIKP